MGHKWAGGTSVAGAHCSAWGSWAEGPVSALYDSMALYGSTCFLCNFVYSSFNKPL